MKLRLALYRAADETGRRFLPNSELIVRNAMGDVANRVECRPGVAADFDRIAEVWWESGRTADGAPADHPSLDDLRARIDRETDAAWEVTVAVRGGCIVGFAALKRRETILDQLFVLPTEQGSGVGRALLERVKAAMPIGFTLRTARENTRARRFYERAGLMLASEGLHPGYGSPVCYYRWGDFDGKGLPGGSQRPSREGVTPTTST